MLPSKFTLIDMAERSLATFAQAFLATVTLGHTVAPALTDYRALEIAGIAGAYAVAKYLLVRANAFLATQPPAPPVVLTVPKATEK